MPVICVALALAGIIYYLHHLKPLEHGLEQRETEMTEKGGSGDDKGLWVGGQETKEEMDETDVAFGQTSRGDPDSAAEDNLISLKVEGVEEF